MPDPAAGGRWALLVASGGGLGLLRPAPGTWGSVGAAAAALGWLVGTAAAGWLGVLGLATGALCAGVGCCLVHGAASRRFGEADAPSFVLDEIAGVWLGLALLPPALLAARPVAAVAVVLAGFRLLDIAKPWPIRALERLPGGLGVLADDAAAGIFAGLAAVALLA